MGLRKPLKDESTVDSFANAAASKRALNDEASEIPRRSQANALMEKIGEKFPELKSFLTLSSADISSDSDTLERWDFFSHDISLNGVFVTGREPYTASEAWSLTDTISHEALHGLVQSYFGGGVRGYVGYAGADLGSWLAMPAASETGFAPVQGVYHRWIVEMASLVRNNVLLNEPRPDLSKAAMLNYRDKAGWEINDGQ